MQRYVLLDTDARELLIVEAASMQDALNRAFAVLRLVQHQQHSAGAVYSVRLLEATEPARLPVFADGYFRLLAAAQPLTATLH